MANNLVEKVVNLPLPEPTEREQLYLRARRMNQLSSKEERWALLDQLEALCRKATKREIAENLAVLLKAFDVGKTDLEAIARIMAEDVGASEPSIGVLELGCRNLRRTAKFRPSIAEVLEAIHEAAQQRIRIFYKLGDHIRQLPSECNVEDMLPEKRDGWRLE